MSGNSPRTASSRFNSLIAPATAWDEFAFSIRRRRTRTAGSLSLIAHLRTNTWASKKELIRTGHAKLGKLASNTPAGRGSLMSCAFDLQSVMMNMLSRTSTVLAPEPQKVQSNSEAWRNRSCGYQQARRAEAVCSYRAILSGPISHSRRGACPFARPKCNSRRPRCSGRPWDLNSRLLN
jgi:hypothetical protein